MSNNYTTIIGDVHGKFEDYLAIAGGSSSSIQLGDFGLGFYEDREVKVKKWLSNNQNHKFIRGNHDNPEVCQYTSGYLGDYYASPEDSLMCIGGAWSIDYYRRSENINWWYDEELTQKQFDEVEKLYCELKPNTVISHDAPMDVPEEMGLLNPLFGGSVATKTGFRLAKLFRLHQPKFWFFGHWHKNAQLQINGCHFQCLNELSFVDFDLKTLEFGRYDENGELF